MPEEIIKKEKKIGLALSGGFIRASSHIGVIEVLEENGIKIDMIAGCSAGAGIASAYACGNLHMIKKRLSEGGSKEYLRVVIEPTLLSKGVFKSNKRRLFFEEFVGDKSFDEIDIKLFVATTDLINMKEVMLSEGKVGKAVAAATAVPGIFEPVDWEDYILVDGANFNSIPSQVLYDNGADYVIAVDTSQTPNFFTQTLAGIKRLLNRREILRKARVPRNNKLNIFQLMARAVNLSSAQIRNFYHDHYKYDIVLQPELKEVNRLNIKYVDYSIQQGRKAALEALIKIKKDLGML